MKFVCVVAVYTICMLMLSSCWPGPSALIFRVRLFERCSLVDCLILKMRALRSFEMSVTLYQSTRCHITELFSWGYKLWKLGTAVAQWLRCCAINRKVAGFIPTGALEFFIDIKSFQSHYGPGLDSASNRNEYQEHFLGGKAAGA